VRKLYGILILFISINLFAQEVNTIRISESFEDISLTKLIRKLRNKYDLKIAYDDALITGITVNGQFTNTALPDFLTQVLNGKGIDYQLLNGKIILIPKQVDLDVSNPSLFDITVFGLVKDASTGESLPNALIRVSGLSRGTISNRNGYFSLPKVPTDTSTIEVSYLGYQKKEVKLKPGETKQTLTVLLDQSALELSDFTVVDNMYRTVEYGPDASQMTIDPKDLAALPSLGELDIFRSLQLLPGIGGTDETSSALTIRNSPSAHNLVLLDGFTIYRLDHFFGVFSAINADAVRDIQIYKGGFGAEYGGRISGVVDITGTTGNFNEPSFSLGVNLMSARIAANLPIDGGRGALHFSGRRAYTDIIRSGLFEKLYRNYRDQSIQNQNFLENSEDFLRPDFYFADFNFKTSYKLTQRDVLSLSLYNGRDELMTGFDAPTFDSNNQITSVDILDEQAEWGNLGLGLLWSRNWNANLYSTFQIARSVHYFNYTYQTESTTRDNDILSSYSVLRLNDVEDWQGNWRNELSIGNRHNLEFGINYSNLMVRNRVLIDGLNSFGNEPQSRSGSIGSIYLSDQFYIGSKLMISPGIRHTLTDIGNGSYFAPRLGLNYQFSPHLKFKGSVGKYYQIIRQEEFDDPLSSNQDGYRLSGSSGNLSIMESDHIIAGLQYEKNSLTIDIEFYNKENDGISEFNVSHLIDPNNLSRSPSTLLTSGSSTIRGIDFLIQKSVKNYQGWISYTRAKATTRLDGINNGGELPSRQDQRNELKLVNILELTDWNLSATWIYGSGRPFYLPDVTLFRDGQGNLVNYEIDNTTKSFERLPAYHRLDFSIARKFDNGYISGEVGLSILNAYNRVNVQGRRLRDLERAIANEPDFNLNSGLYRDIVLLDFTPSFFFNINF